WWGSWAENENRDTLTWYLLDELSTYENDHKHLLVKPIYIQDLQLMHECISADVAGLRSDLHTLTAMLYNGQLTHLPNSLSSTGMCNALHSSTLLSNLGNPCIIHHSSGSQPPSSEAASWRQIMKHWTDDWLPEWIHGKNKKFFAMKYHQHLVIALEFLDQFNGHEPAFLTAYPEATVGHTALLQAINRMKKECGDIIP
ncbi:uncharacterized protein F5891DRAFT_1073509, partial [Suillus fuscotomentosus]